VTRQGFEEEFLKKYITREKRNTWYKQLKEIQQGNKNINIYNSKFKKLKQKLNPDNELPEEFYLQKYINRLNEKITRKVIEEDIKTLNEAIERTKQIKKERNYKKPKTEITKIEI